jgi:hypothetical protein
MAATPPAFTRWPSGQVFYTIDSGHPLQSAIIQSLQYAESVTPIQYIPRTNQPNYVEFIYDLSNRSESQIGMTGVAQQINLTKDFLVLHELGHALGFIHEQSRNDRDNYVLVVWDNIVGGDTNGNFQLEMDSQNISSYDVTSVMHYGWNWQAVISELPTLVWKADPFIEVGPEKWQVYSALDIRAIQQLY